MEQTGLPHEWRLERSLAATTLADMDRAHRRVCAGADCCPQMARDVSLVSLRFRLHLCGMASARTADDPRTPYPAAQHTQTIPATAAAGRCICLAPGKQRGTFSQLDSRGKGQNAPPDSRPLPI